MDVINETAAAATEAVSVTVTEMSLPDSLIMSLIGMVIVFAVLVVLMAFIKVMSFAIGNKKGEAAPDSKTPAAVNVPIAAPSSAGVRLNNVPEKNAAIIMAIVADEMKAPLNTLRFHYIKEIK